MVQGKARWPGYMGGMAIEQPGGYPVISDELFSLRDPKTTYSEPSSSKEEDVHTPFPRNKAKRRPVLGASSNRSLINHLQTTVHNPLQRPRLVEKLEEDQENYIQG